MISQPPQLDDSRIEFPSDRLTLGDLRKMRLDTPAPEIQWSLSGEAQRLSAMQSLERDFARLGFATVLGNAEDVRREIAAGFTGGIQDPIDDLVQFYMRYRLAEGPETAQELIRRVQEAGTARW